MVLDRGRSRASSTVVVYAHPSAAKAHRIGLVVSRRVGSAVVRNRVKRVVREQFRTHRHQLAAGQILDFVVIAKRRAADVRQPLAADVLWTLQALARKVTQPNSQPCSAKH